GASFAGSWVDVPATACAHRDGGLGTARTSAAYPAVWSRRRVAGHRCRQRASCGGAALHDARCADRGVSLDAARDVVAPRATEAQTTTPDPRVLVGAAAQPAHAARVSN